MSDTKTRRSSRLVMGVVAIVVLLGLAYRYGPALFADRADTAKAVSAATAATAASTASRDTNPSKAPYPWASDARAATIAKTRRDFEQATDLQAFFAQALQRPEAGGLYYAKNAMMDCASLRMVRAAPRATELQSGTAEALAAAPAKLDAALARCNGLGDQASFAAFLAARNGATNDPMMSLLTAEMQSRQPRMRMAFDPAAQMMQRATDLGDPYFLAESMGNFDDAARTFDGAPLDGGLRMGLTQRASVIACDLGADCTHDSPSVRACYRDGDCAPMAQRLIRPMNFSKQDPGAMVRFVADLTNAAREGTLLARYGK